MPKTTVVEVPPEEPVQMLAALRRARYGSLLALHILWLCAAGRTPTAIAAAHLCSRSSVYRTVRASRKRTLDWDHAAQGRLLPPLRPTVLLPTLRRSRVALLQATPRTSGWWRTRWRCATLALTLQAKRGLIISAETMRRWLHELGWVWTRATLVAKDDDPHRVERWARSRSVCEQRKGGEAMVFAEELDLPLWPKVGCAWMPTGAQREVMTPGQNQKHYLAGALELSPGTLHYCPGPRKPNALFRDLLTCLDARYPAERYTQLDVVVDHYKIHQANVVEPWLATHPRVTQLFLPTSCPRANPIERAFGDVHDCCTRNHQRKRLPALVVAVEDHLRLNGPWQDKLSDLDYEPAVTRAVEKIIAEEQAQVAA
jgi:putative transposase